MRKSLWDFFSKQDKSIDLAEGCWKDQVFSNYHRLKIFALVLAMIVMLLFFSDHNNYQNGLWEVSAGYQRLFYSHVVFEVGLLIFTTLYWKSKLLKASDVRWTHRAYEIGFAWFVLMSCAVTSGWIDQLIHGQLTVYIIACFTISALFNIKPFVSFWLFSSSYVVLVVGIILEQHDLQVLNGHCVNALYLVLIAWFISMTLYKSRVRELIQQNHLELLVKERTTELEGINVKLTKEVWERRQIEEKVLRLASIVESTDDGIMGMTLEGLLIDWNRGAECIYGYTEAEIIGKSVLKLIPPDKEIEFNKIFSKVTVGMPVTHYETTRRKKDGQDINVYLTSSPIKDHTGEVIGASVITRDVTAQRKIEKEMIRMDQMNIVGEMAANLGHEVRNPMTTVRGFLQLLEESKNYDRYSEYIPLMISELDRVNDIITEFLSISRTKPTEFTQLDLNKIITNIIPLVQVNGTRAGKWATAKLNPIPDLYLNDKEIRQIILNLTRNAFDAMNEGGCIHIETFLEDNEVVMAISDEGTGIEPEIMERIGSPFFTTKEQGTGLGLAICYGIADRHKAKIIIETSSGGSTFSVKFPKTFDHN